MRIAAMLWMLASPFTASAGSASLEAAFASGRALLPEPFSGPLPPTLTDEAPIALCWERPDDEWAESVGLPKRVCLHSIAVRIPVTRRGELQISMGGMLIDPAVREHARAFIRREGGEETGFLSGRPAGDGSYRLSALFGDTPVNDEQLSGALSLEMKLSPARRLDLSGAVLDGLVGCAVPDPSPCPIYERSVRYQPVLGK